MINWITASLFFLVGFVLQVGFILTGIVVCMLPKRKDESQQQPFSEYPGVWFPVHLPKLAWPWDNEEDGARGDHRGWYWVDYMGDKPDWLKYYFWLAFRNPANNFKRYKLGVDIRKVHIETLYGQDYVRDDFDSTGWQLVKGTGETIPRWHFYGVWRYGSSDRALVIELGNKIQVRHNGEQYDDPLDYWKGFTFEINVYKDIS